MQIVIDVPDYYMRFIDDSNPTLSEYWILSGKKLPEHGRLIDADALEREMIIAEGKAEGGCDYYMADTIDKAKEYVINAETIIPATKEGAE